MEKFFIVTEKSGLHKEYSDYLKSVKEVNELYKAFSDMFDIKATNYLAYSDHLYIIPTEDDLIHFDKSLGKEVSQGLRPFKRNSTINKEWTKSIKSKKYKVLRSPLVQFYFKNCSNSRYRIFENKDAIYCSYENDYDVDIPEGFTEIKASEFYKVIEDSEE
jgi:hypothetical protein